MSVPFILVAVDASPHSLAALETAAKVAACLKAELRGVYVEDIDLVRTAALPFACAISSSGQAQRLTPDALERQLRRQAETARRAIEAAGSRSRVTWSFSVVRGAVRREIARAAASLGVPVVITRNIRTVKSCVRPELRKTAELKSVIERIKI
jgi:nucleotide-binding universal stress UspA family protein